MQRNCAWALVMMDPQNAEYVDQALPRLIAGLSNEMPLIRRECAVAIQKVGPKAKAAVPELLKALASSTPDVQVEILDALAQIGPAAKPAIPDAVKLLNNPNPTLKYTAIHLLGALGKDAQEAAPALQKLMKDQDEFGQAVAAWALVSINPTPEHIRQAVPLMIKGLGHGSPEVARKRRRCWEKLVWGTRRPKRLSNKPCKMMKTRPSAKPPEKLSPP